MTYDDLWRFMTFYVMEQRDGNCHKMSQVVVKCRKLSWRLSQIVRAARVQNETAPETFLNRYEKRFEKREEGSEKRSETRLKNF